MRKLAWAALGFAAAVISAEYSILPYRGLPYIAAALAALSLLGLLIRGDGGRRVVLCLLSAAVGVLWWWGHYTLHILPCEAVVGETVEITAVVTDYPQIEDDYTRVEVRITDGAPKEKAVLYLYYAELNDVQPGDIITAEIKITSALTRSGETTHIFTAKNQNLLGYIQDNVSVTGQSAWAWVYFPQRLCQSVKDLCDEIFEADTAPFMKALLTSDTLWRSAGCTCL